MLERQPIGEGRPVWDDVAPPEDVAALDPGPADLPRTPDVLVVGGGQIGLAVAAMCIRAGVRDLVLIERERLATGPSGCNGGFLLVDVHRSWPEEWRTMSARSFELHRELDAEWDNGLRLLDLCTTDRLLLPEQGHVNPLRVAASYARHAGTVATGVEAVVIERDGERVTRVRTSLGDVEPGIVVIATGACPPVAGDVRQDLVKGHVLATEPASFVLDSMVVDGEVGVAQLANGRLVCGGTKDYDDATSGVVDATVDRLRGAMVALAPAAKGLTISHAWSCFRPRFADEFPVIDRFAENGYVVVGMFATGLLMAPAVGELLAEWMTGGRPPAAAAAFSLNRAAIG
jgi:sarcosine oxidase subunit beta